MKDYSISVDQDRYSTSIVKKYLDSVTVNTRTKLYETALPSDMIFTKYDASTRYEQVKEMTSDFNIHHRDCIRSFIYLLSTIVDLSFAVHKLANLS